MDLVLGKQDVGAILTFLFPSIQFMLGYKVKSKEAYEIVRVFDEIEAKIGIRAFRKLFGCILTDQGGEFQKNKELCTSKITLGIRTKIFYCHPSSPYEKPNIENVHILLRKVFPKNTSLKEVTTEDVQEVVSNINSLKKTSLNGKAPNELFIKAFGKNLLNKLSLRVYESEDVILKKY